MHSILPVYCQLCATIPSTFGQSQSHELFTSSSSVIRLLWGFESGIFNFVEVLALSHIAICANGGVA